jgi:preprotein translocase subunit SecG
MDFISSAKNLGSSAFGSSSSGASGDSGGGGGGGSGMFSNFFNLSIQKMVLILAVIAFVISVGTVAILLWKSKSSQKWPPEIAKCPDRMAYDGTKCTDNYGLGIADIIPAATDCLNYGAHKARPYTNTTLGLNGNPDNYVPWEGIVDGKESRAASLKCAV